jgi:hypothetical protein
MSNNLLFKNNLTVTSVEFDKINNSTVLIFIDDKIEQGLYALTDYNGNNLISSDNLLLVTSSI